MDYNIIREIDLDFYNRKNIFVEAKQYDMNSRYISVSCHNQGNTYILDKNIHTTYVRYKKSDESIIFNTCEITDDGKILIELTQQMLSSPGNCIADIMVFSAGEEPCSESTMKFYVNVIPNPYPNSEIESQDEFGALEDLMNKALADYEYVMENAQKSADDAAESEKNAKYSETNAAKSAEESATSASNAKDSENKAKESEISAENSATTATNKAKEASDYATEAESFAHGNTGTREGEDTDNGLYYKNESDKSASEAKSSEDNAKNSEINAGISETNADRSATESAESASQAKISENNAKISENNSAYSADKARLSEDNAKASEENAKNSADAAYEKAIDAENSANVAKTSADNAKASEHAAEGYASTAIEKATDASNSATQAGQSAEEAAGSAEAAEKSAYYSEDYSKLSESWAHGNTGVRVGENTNNSEYFSSLADKLVQEAQKLLEQAQKIVAAATQGALIPAGTITFSQLPSNPEVGYMYNISDDFTTDSRFVEGAGVFYRAGANVYWTKDGKWDVMIGAQVTGVKGDAESNYHIGNVNITKANIGLGNVPNVTTNNQTPTFTQTFERENISSGNTLSVIFGKIMKWFSDLKTVAFSGSYNDLDNKPTIPAAIAVKGNAESSYRTGNVNLTPANIGALATANVANNLTTTASGYALDARQGKVLQDRHNVQTYYNLEQLGIISDFIPDIIAAMPGNSIFISTVTETTIISSNTANKLPISFGAITIEKIGAYSRVIFSAQNSGSTLGLYLASINTQTNVINGWYKIDIGTLIS